MSSNNINPEVIKMLDQLARWRARQLGGYSPQAQQLYGELGNNAKNILKGNKLFGIAGFVPDMLQLQGMYPMTQQEAIEKANQYYRNQGYGNIIDQNGNMRL